MDTYLVMLLLTAEQEHAIRYLFQQRGWKFYKTGSRQPVKEELQLLYDNTLSQKSSDNVFRNVQPYLQMGPYMEQQQQHQQQQQYGRTQNLVRNVMNLLPYNISEMSRGAPSYNSQNMMGLLTGSSLGTSLDSPIPAHSQEHVPYLVAGSTGSLADSSRAGLPTVSTVANDRVGIPVENTEVSHQHSNNNAVVTSQNSNLSDISTLGRTHLENRTYEHLQSTLSDSIVNSGLPCHSNWENKDSFQNSISTGNSNPLSQPSGTSQLYNDNVADINKFDSESVQKRNANTTEAESLHIALRNEKSIIEHAITKRMNKPEDVCLTSVTDNFSDSKKINETGPSNVNTESVAHNSSDISRQTIETMKESENNYKINPLQQQKNKDSLHDQIVTHGNAGDGVSADISGFNDETAVNEMTSKIIASYIKYKHLIPAEGTMIVEKLEQKIKKILGSILINKNTEMKNNVIDEEYLEKANNTITEVDSEMEDNTEVEEYDNMDKTDPCKADLRTVNNYQSENSVVGKSVLDGDENEILLDYIEIKVEKESVDQVDNVTQKRKPRTADVNANKRYKKKGNVKKQKDTKEKNETNLGEICEATVNTDELENAMRNENKNMLIQSRARKRKMANNQKKKRTCLVKEKSTAIRKNSDDTSKEDHDNVMEDGVQSSSKHRWSVSRNIRMHGFHRKCSVAPLDLDSENYSQSWKGYFCPDCNFIFKGKNKLTLHKSLKGGHCSQDCIYCDKDAFKDIYECSKCPKCFRTKELLDKHEERHRGDAFCCQYCDNGFYTVIDLKLHIQENHSNETQESHLCDLCGSKFAEKKVMVAHRKYVHTEERPEECPTCGRRFKTKSQLKNHLVVHKDITDLNLSCEICGKMFMRAATLRDHVRRHKKDFSTFCQICGKGFYRMSGLDEHMRIHTGVKPFECKVCGYKCALSCNLKKHLKIHTKL